MNNPLDNVLHLALAKDELDKLLVGEPFYFLEAKVDNDEPQNVAAAFDQLILPYWRQTHDASFPTRFVAALLTLLATYPDRNRAIYIAHDWVWYYRFCQDRQRKQPQGPYGDLFDIDLGGVAVALKHQLESRKADLQADTRWRARPGTARTACGRHCCVRR